MFNVFIIYKPNDRDELGTIARRVGMTKKDMLYIFDTFMTAKRDTLCIDLTEDTPAPLRKNLFTPILKSDTNYDA